MQALKAYPNPFRKQTQITYALPSSMEVKVELYDVLGKKLKNLEVGKQSKGEHNIIFEGDDRSDGVYFVKLTFGEETKTLKLVELK